MELGGYTITAPNKWEKDVECYQTLLSIYRYHYVEDVGLIEHLYFKYCNGMQHMQKSKWRDQQASVIHTDMYKIAKYAESFKSIKRMRHKS